MNSLKEIVANKIKTQLRYGDITLKDLEILDNHSRELIMEKIHEYDLKIWRRNIMNSLAKISLDKATDYWGVWEKYYDDWGLIDFREIIYIMRGTLEYVEIITPDDSPYYYNYVEAYREKSHHIQYYPPDKGYPYDVSIRH